MRSLFLLAVVLSFTALPACPLGGEGEGEGEAGEGEGEAGEGGEGEGEGEVDFDGRSFVCDEGVAIETPVACAVDADCTTARVSLDCCGTPRDTGVNVDDAAAFVEAYADCTANAPVCDCIPASLSADDGSLDDGSLAVACVSGSCTTTFGVADRQEACGLGGEAQFEASCAVVADCSFVTAQVDCCGSLVATGVTNDARRTLPITIEQCSAGFPDCDCVSQPTLADDGSTAVNLNDEPLVDCIAGLCTTFFNR